jgi:hypothetical protein
MKYLIALSILILLTNFTASADSPCTVVQCSCVATDSLPTARISSCQNDLEKLCYDQSQCVQQNGSCMWTNPKWLKTCVQTADQLNTQIETQKKVNQLKCVRTGCEGVVCSDKPIIMGLMCRPNPKAVCYKDAECSVQNNSACGWTKSPKLDACLARQNLN